jgi:hypothetical protein
MMLRRIPFAVWLVMSVLAITVSSCCTLSRNVKSSPCSTDDGFKVEVYVINDPAEGGAEVAVRSLSEPKCIWIGTPNTNREIHLMGLPAGKYEAFPPRSNCLQEIATFQVGPGLPNVVVIQFYEKDPLIVTALPNPALQRTDRSVALRAPSCVGR